jgi:hypothetical protein
MVDISTSDSSTTLQYFLEQSAFDDATIYDRVSNSTQGLPAHPTSREPVYEAKAANTIATFEAAFAAGQNCKRRN